MTIHVSGLLDDGHLAALCDIVGGGLEGHRTPGTVRPHVPGDTIALVAADADGWGVSLIQSLYSGFGAGILEPATGDRPARPRRLFSRSSPGIPTSSRRASGRRTRSCRWPCTATAVPSRSPAPAAGAANPQGFHLMTLVQNLLDLGLDPFGSVAAPRWLVGGMSPLLGEQWVEVEGSVPAAIPASFEREGFRVETVDAVDRSVGHAQLLRIDGEALVAGSDRSRGRRCGGIVRSHPASDLGHRADWQTTGHLAD